MKDVTPNEAAAILGRLGGLAGKGKTSPAKARAARRNGKLGGRPRKEQPMETTVKATCIKGGCGMPFDPNEPKPTHGAFWYRYCPKHAATLPKHAPITQVESVSDYWDPKKS